MSRTSSSATAQYFLNVVLRDSEGNCSTLANALRERPSLPKSNDAFRTERAIEIKAWQIGENLEPGQDGLVLAGEAFLAALARNGITLELRVRRPGDGTSEADADADAILGIA